MLDLAALAAATLGAALPYIGAKLEVAADAAAKAAGGKVVDWLKAKLTSPAEKEALAKVAAQPDSAGARTTLQGLLLTRLEADKSLAEELAKLLAAAGHNVTATQTATVIGNNSAVSQIAGGGNTVKIGRP